MHFLRGLPECYTCIGQRSPVILRVCHARAHFYCGNLRALLSLYFSNCLRPRLKLERKEVARCTKVDQYRSYKRFLDASRCRDARPCWQGWRSALPGSLGDCRSFLRSRLHVKFLFINRVIPIHERRHITASCGRFVIRTAAPRSWKALVSPRRSWLKPSWYSSHLYPETV